VIRSIGVWTQRGEWHEAHEVWQDRSHGQFETSRELYQDLSVIVLDDPSRNRPGRTTSCSSQGKGQSLRRAFQSIPLNFVHQTVG
jgi:hypothetical protein